MTELEIMQHAKNYLDNLDAIIAINATPLHENQCKPWEPE